MAVEDAKKQDYLAVGNYSAQIRQDSTFHVDLFTTTDSSVNRFLTTAATRLAGIRLTTDTVIASGSVAVTVSRVRAGVLATLASFTLNGSILTATHTVVELDTANILKTIGVKAGDGIRIVALGAGPPTAANISMVLQFAQNGPR